ncbi:hypothetical protein GVN21_14745 [Caulobacter sp. SLTY]|uniref:hypothetical protein n=1 Tax=Caulobacter sp. SLTY TaxID=2683262 RepID=UPI0014135815|nr:hypothetical protein [Caulobacter sp. SLTY]NBB16619.1 hypothetical protein [Caulobacter sp. SLTY]
MADGFDIHVDRDRAGKLADVAEAAGLTPEAYVLSLVDQAIAGNDDGWAEDMARLAEYDLTGVASPAKEVFDRIEAKIRARMAVGN